MASNLIKTEKRYKILAEDPEFFCILQVRNKK